MIPATVNGRLVYAAYVETGQGLRLRVEADEAERLGLFEGHMAEVRVPGHRSTRYHVLSMTSDEPYWIWAELLAAPTAPRVWS